MLDNNHFSAIQIRLASPETIRSWSHGEVTRPETINYRSLKPEPDGLFCQRIFGPQKDYECYCGRYKKTSTTRRDINSHHVCEQCGVEITKSSVRREYMGHIHLAAPVVHLWYLKGTPCYLKMLLEISPKNLENIIYYASYVVLDPGSCADPTVFDPADESQKKFVLKYKETIDEKRWSEIQAECRKKSETVENFKMPVVGMGASAIKTLLQQLDLNAEAEKLRAEAEESGGQKHTNVVKRLEIFNAFISSGNKPEWIVLEDLPVIPPDLRPMVQLDGGRFATSDLNDLYRKVITRNNRLKKSQEIHAPNIIIRCEMRILQEAVDALIDNSRRDKRPTTGPGNRPLKSLTSMLKGKQGRFRQNLLGKRVDYSGRSVIVVGPELKMYQCGLPKEMALELFRPFVIKKLTESSSEDGKDKTINIKAAKNMIERAQDDAVWKALEEVIKNHPVLLNRAPTLHRLGIQAFEPVLVEGRALKLHPLVCTAYNADFDGDQMAVHVPLSIEAQAEARFLMLASNNILKPQDGTPVVCPTQDMVLGCYYLTSVRDNPRRTENDMRIYYCEDEAMYAYSTGNVTLQEPIRVNVKRTVNGVEYEQVINATVGKLILNAAIPQDLGYVDRSIPGNECVLEIDFKVRKKDLAKIIDRCYRRHGPTDTSAVLDKIKALGFKYSTRGGITVGYKDVKVPEAKKQLIAEAEAKVDAIEAEYSAGFLSAKNRKDHIIKIWSETMDTVSKALMDSFDEFNPIMMMADSGARGNKNQITQLAGMRGLMNDTSGDIIEVPVKSNFREGLTVLEFFVSSHGARKGLTDTALKTADSGYLTRRLVDVSQDVIVRQDDCFAQAGKPIVGSVIEAIMDGEKVVVPLGNRILGRYTAAPVFNPQTGEMIIDTNQRITMDIRDAIVAAGVTQVNCRTVFNCQCEHGVCRKCYGDNLATGNQVDIGEAVGIIAAQAIGEPGTQLTMRTFHTGGVASASDITTGLPRVEEIFEARKPKGVAVLSEIAGTVKIQVDRKTDVIVTPLQSDVLEGADSSPKSYTIPVASRLRVKDGDTVAPGEALTEGALNPNEVLRISGAETAQQYLLREVHKVYSSQGVDLADKHIEIIIRQMMRKVQVEDAGDTNMLPGEVVDRFKANDENDAIAAENARLKAEFNEKLANGEASVEDEPTYLRPATLSNKLLGITKASLATESFLSAAAFQETTRILTDAAIKGKIDPLIGLKENIIIGKLIPAGIGMDRYSSFGIERTGTDDAESPVMPENAAHIENTSEYDSEEFDGDTDTAQGEQD